MKKNYLKLDLNICRTIFKKLIQNDIEKGCRIDMQEWITETKKLDPKQAVFAIRIRIHM